MFTVATAEFVDDHVKLVADSAGDAVAVSCTVAP
jgi:hypothetical protein